MAIFSRAVRTPLLTSTHRGLLNPQTMTSLPHHALLSRDVGGRAVQCHQHRTGVVLFNPRLTRIILSSPAGDSTLMRFSFSLSSSSFTILPTNLFTTPHCLSPADNRPLHSHLLHMDTLKGQKGHARCFRSPRPLVDN